jgi:hypothetical protein
VRARATVGEISDALRAVWGTYAQEDERRETRDEGSHRPGRSEGPSANGS